MIFGEFNPLILFQTQIDSSLTTKASIGESKKKWNRKKSATVKSFKESTGLSPGKIVCQKTICQENSDTISYGSKKTYSIPGHAYLEKMV